MIRDHLPDQKGPGLIQSGLIRLTLLRLCMRRLGCRIGPDRSNQAIWKFPTCSGRRPDLETDVRSERGLERGYTGDTPARRARAR